jgi:hypothetical protein
MPMPSGARCELSARTLGRRCLPGRGARRTHRHAAGGGLRTPATRQSIAATRTAYLRSAHASRNLPDCFEREQAAFSGASR